MNSVPPDTPDELNEAEQFLVAAVGRGEAADLKRHTIRGSVLRDLILGARPGWTVRESGIRIQKAVIDGGLDLEGCTIDRPLLIWYSRIQGGGDRGALLIRDAKVKRLALHNSTIDGSIIADRIEIANGMFLGGGLVKGLLQIRGGAIDGALAIEGTTIGDGKSAILAAGLAITGPLILRRAQVKGEVAFPRAELAAGIYGEDVVITKDGTAINGESSRIAGDLLLDRANITGSIKLTNARVGGQITADGMIVAATPEALIATGLNVEQGLTLSNARIAGSVRLEGASIGKSFVAEGTEVWGDNIALRADNIRIGGNWALGRSKFLGRIECSGAEVAGQLRLTDARLQGDEIAIRADGSRFRGGCFMARMSVTGLARFQAVEVGNQFRLTGATLKAERGAALLAAGSSFNRDVELDGGLSTVGAVVLDQARIRGTCDLGGSRLASVALSPDPVRPQRPAPSGADGDPMRPELDSIAVSLVDARIGRLRMPVSADDRPRGIVDLSRASVGSFVDFAAAWPPDPLQRGRSGDGREVEHLVLDGFTYEHLGNPSGAVDEKGAAEADASVGARRTRWLESQSAQDLVAHFKPQAWMQLASRLDAQGYHDDARTITIARRRRERRSPSIASGQRWQSRILDLFALYGLNPWRTVAWMAATVLVFAGLWAWAGAQCGQAGCYDENVFVMSNRDAYTQGRPDMTYPPFNALGYSFDVFVPFVAFGYEDHWRPNVDWRPLIEVGPADLGLGRRLSEALPDYRLRVTGGGLLYVMVVLEMLAGLILTSLAVTGFTGLLKGSS